MKHREVLFKVLTGLGDHEYVIYDNGEIEGFSDDAIVLNYYPALLKDAIYRSGSKGMSSAPVCETRGCASDLVGASHGTPE